MVRSKYFETEVYNAKKRMHHLLLALKKIERPDVILNWSSNEMYSQLKMLEFIFVSLLLFTINVDGSQPTLRMTTNGMVEGIEQISVMGQTFYAFKGIPFAAPPITGSDPYTGKFVDRRFKVL